MPQDRLRSAVYRSFVTCHDPQDVLDCRTMRKSKNSGKKMDQKSEIRRNGNTVCRETMEDFNGGSSFQLLEVSREAGKLNQVIDSWSKRMNSDGKSKEIAEDLLKGSLHLKKSLVFLGKFQEDSAVQLQKKKMIQSERVDEMKTQITYSNQVGIRKNGSEEIKKVIRMTFEKQNSKFGERNLDSPSEISFTSSSKSSMESTISSESSQKMEKGTNLIARLMGLEEMPCKSSLQATYQKKLQASAEMPKTTKIQSVIKRADQEHKSLKEILETMQFKGLLESKSVREFDAATPIVLIKPGRNIDSDDRKKTVIHAGAKIIQAEAVVSKKTFIKTKIKEESKRKSEVEEIPVERTSREERKASSPVNPKPVLKHSNAKKSMKLQEETKTTDPLVKKSVKVELHSRPQDQAKETTIRPEKPAIKANPRKKKNQSHLIHRSDQTNVKKDHREKSAKASRQAKSLEKGDREDHRSIDLLNETSLVDLPLIEEKKVSSKPEIREVCHENQITGEKPCNYLPLSGSDSHGFKTATNLKDLLLNSPFFINQAEKLFNIRVNYEAILHVSERKDCPIPGSRLLFDCALELIEYKSLRNLEAAFKPHLISSWENSRTEVCLDSLVEEICRGIQKLGSLRKIDCENVSEEAFYALLKRDVESRGNITGLWDLGWRNLYPLEEAEQAVNYIEKLVFSELIEEIFT